MTAIAQFSTSSIGKVEVPSLDLDFSNSRSIFAKKGASPVLSRNSIGTYVDEYGIIRNSNPNLLLYSNTLESTGGSWSSSSNVAAVTIATNQALSPDNSTNASLLTFPAIVDGSGNYAVWKQTVSTTISGYYTFSAWFKNSGSLTAIWMRIRTNVGDAHRYRIVSIPLYGWRRASFSVYISSAITEISVEIGARNIDSSEFNTSAGTIYVWGAQLERSSYVGKYSPTTTTSVNNGPRLHHNLAKIKTYTTNYISSAYNTSFDDAYWTKTQIASISSNIATAPDGTLTADRIIENTVSGNHGISRNIALAQNPNREPLIQTFSIFIKKYVDTIDSRYAMLAIWYNSDANVAIMIDLLSGICTDRRYYVFEPLDLSEISLISYFNYNIYDYGTYWRVSISDRSSTNSSNEFRCYMSNVSTLPTNGWTFPSHIGTSKGMTLWGAQLEINVSNKPTTFIPNTTGIETYECLGLLIEESRTNLLTYSEDFSNILWGKNNLTSTTANFAIAPDGLFSAYKIFEDANNTYHSISFGVVSITGQPYTGSIFIRKYTGNATERRYAQLFLSTGTTGSPPPRYLINIDLQTGTVTDAVIKTGATGTSQKIEDYGTYWKVSISIIAADTSLSMILAISNSATPTYHGWGDVIYAGNPLLGIVIWGAQIEQGAFSTSYIPTSGAAVTRNADSCSISSTDFTNFYNQTEGTSRIEYNSRPNPSGTYSLATYKDNTNAFFLKQYRTQLAETSLYKGDASIGAQFDYASQGVDGVGKMVISYKSNDFSSAFNGGSFGVDASGVVSPFTSLNIGSDQNSANFLNGCISRFRYYNKKITNNKIKSSSYQDELNWRNVGSQYYQNYKSSIANTAAATTTLDIVVSPSPTFAGSRAFSGGVLLPDGRVFCIPYNSTTAKIYNPTTDTVYTPPITFAGSGAFSGGVLMEDGRVFCIPHNSLSAKIYDPITDKVSTPSVTFAGSGAFVGGVVLPNGKIFCAPYNSTTALIYDPITDTSITCAGFPGNGGYRGAVLLDATTARSVACIPFKNTSIIIFYNYTSNTITTRNPGVVPSSNGTFCGGIFRTTGKLGTLELFAYGVADVVSLDLSTNSAIINGEIITAETFPFNGVVLLPNGNTFCIPYNSTYGGIYNGNALLTYTASSDFIGSGAFEGGVVLLDGRVFCVPSNSTVARIYNAGGTFDKNVVLSPYYNKL